MECAGMGVSRKHRTILLPAPKRGGYCHRRHRFLRSLTALNPFCYQDLQCYHSRTTDEKASLDHGEQRIDLFTTVVEEESSKNHRIDDINASVFFYRHPTMGAKSTRSTGLKIATHSFNLRAGSMTCVRSEESNGNESRPNNIVKGYANSFARKNVDTKTIIAFLIAILRP